MGVVLTGAFVAIVWWQEGTQVGIVTAFAFGVPQVALFPLAREALHRLTGGVVGGDPESNVWSPSDLFEVPVLGQILFLVWLVLTLILWALAIPVGLVMWIVLAVQLSKT